MSVMQLNINPIIYTGKWDDIHRLGFAARNPRDCQSFASCLRIICYTHYCGNCRQHATAYIEQIKPEIYFVNCFYYTVMFHNSVNSRLGKPVIGYETALSWYMGTNGDKPPHFNSRNIYIGKWNDIHTIAAYADLSNGNMMVDYEWALNVICNTLPDRNYSNNCMMWLRENPARHYFRDHQCFLHSWKLHDYINSIANRPLNRRVNYEDAKNWYVAPRTRGCTAIPDRERPGILIMSCEQ